MPILASGRCRTQIHYGNAKDEETTKSIRPAGRISGLYVINHRRKADRIKRNMNDGNGRRDNYGYRVCDVGGSSFFHGCSLLPYLVLSRLLIFLCGNLGKLELAH
ncbi:hypothetical protein XPA_006644 [Xanthoria parietina]